MRKVLMAAVLAMAGCGISVDGGSYGSTREWLVLNTAGGTTLTNTSGRQALELQNLGPNAIFCTTGGETPVTTGVLGRKIDAGATWSLQASSAIAIKCIAGTADQVTGAATQVTELR